MTHYFPTVVGTLTLDEPTEHTDRSFPSASWWRKLQLQPGTYDVVATYSREMLDRPYYLTVTIPGVTVDEYFVSRILHHSVVSPPRIGVRH